MARYQGTAYHGTDAEPFESFDQSFMGPWKFGFWFADDQEFTKVFGADVNICEAEIRLENPKTITQEKWNDIRDDHARDAQWFSRWKERLRAAGHDGLRILPEEFVSSGGMKFRDPEIFAVFDPENVTILNWVPKAGLTPR